MSLLNCHTNHYVKTPLTKKTLLLKASYCELLMKSEWAAKIYEHMLVNSSINLSWFSTRLIFS
ncbi:hypothetical protein GCM10028825_53890 [Spirosoma agri]